MYQEEKEAEKIRIAQLKAYYQQREKELQSALDDSISQTKYIQRKTKEEEETTIQFMKMQEEKSKVLNK